MADSSQVDTIIACLEDVLNRPGMYLGPFNDVPHVVAFLNGFDTACAALGFSPVRLDVTYQSVVRERGWFESSTRGIWDVMHDRGLDEHEIVRELVVVELEVWKRRTSPLSSSR